MTFILAPIQTPEFVAAQIGVVNTKVSKIVTIFGRRNQGWASTTGYGDVSNYLNGTQDRNNDVVLGTEYFIRSSSPADTVDGLGARTVRVVILDATGHQQTITVTLNGTTGVSLGAGISYVEWAEVASVGSNTTPVGNLTVSSVPGAPTVAQIVEYLQAGENRSRSARYKVPTGFVAHLTSWDCEAVGNNQDLSVRATVFSDDRSLSSVFHIQDSFYLPGNTTGVGASLHYLSCPTASEIKVSSIPTAAGAGNRADATLHLLLVAN